VPLTFDVITIFPGMFSGILNESIVARAIQAEKISVRFTDLRDFTTDRHRSVDDKSYGGGPGMVLKPEPVFEAVEHLLRDPRVEPRTERIRKLLLSPQGKRLVQDDLVGLAAADRILLLSGHYEGFDERIRDGLDFEEVSIGDYVLTGGEIPAMVVIDGVARLVPGVLGNEDSLSEESFNDGLLDFPHYTRPEEFRGMRVPEVLLSGNHQEIARWRKARAVERTKERRADLSEENDEENDSRD
jgi:tRNA (guanine37-N1)-methyltransferase